MKLYRCELCGRVFNQKTPHKCYGGCFRKHCLTYIEFDDTDNEYIKKSDFDVKENNFPNIPQGSIILKEPLEYIEYKVNWKQARVDAAIAAMQGKLADHTAISRLWHCACEDTSTFHRLIADSAVQLADALIAELKKTNETK